MNFFDKILGKKESPIVTYSDFWDWFLKHEKEFFKVVKSRQNINKNFFNRLAPKLDELHEGIYFLTGMFNDQTAELILTPDGIIKNIYMVEDLVNNAPQINGWKFTALKSGSNRKDFSIEYDGIKFSTENLKFYPNVDKDYPDEIDLIISYDNYNEEKKSLITNAVYIFLDNYLGELSTVTLIDKLKVVGVNDISQELIPMEKLKDYLIWREKEFIEKYEGTRHNTENDGYANFEWKIEGNKVVLALINTTLLEWDKKASHPWIITVGIPFKKTDESGLPDDETYKLLDEIEEEIMFSLPDSDGYLNIGRETSDGKREIFFACKEFRKPPKVLDQIIKKYSQKFEMDYEIYKDKYWQSFKHFEQK